MSKTRTKADGPPVKFEGLKPYLDAKARDREVSAELAGKAGATWYARQIQNSLGAISENAGNVAISDDARQKMMDAAASVCRSFHAAAEGCADAVAEMARRHGLAADLPESAAETTKALDLANAEIAALTNQLAARDKADAEAAKAASAKAPSPPQPSK